MDTKKTTEEEQWDKDAPFTNQRMETRKLTFFVIFMSICVFVLFGLAPPI